MGEVRSISLKNAKHETFYAHRTRDENFVRSEFKGELVLF
jgi:hypothetical protein